MTLKSEIINLYKETAADLPKDVTNALKRAEKNEVNSAAIEILKNILKNIKLAKDESKPICQDTGTPIFYVKYPRKYSQKQLRDIINEATDVATKEIPLRPNSVDVLTDKNNGNVPIIHFEESEKLKITLMLKGGGSENISAVYQLPNEELKAERNMDGVRKCILDAVFRAQGKGCPPYIIGVAIGGNIEEVAHLSKKELLREITDFNLNPELKNLEKDILTEINQLGIGPMGLGGKTTALAVKINSSVRHPASFFVGISFGCWCLRRRNV